LRQIGSLTDEDAARRLADYLLTLNMHTQIRPEALGWGLWVLEEDRLPLARQEFETFRDHPDDPRFGAAARTAETIRREEGRREKQYRKNFRSVTDAWSRPNLRRRPLTFALIVVSVIVFFPVNTPGTQDRVRDALAFSSLHVEQVDGQMLVRRGGLEDLTRGELWRVITPIFMHFGIAHLLFDLWALALFGTLIETRRSTWVLLLLVLGTAVASNLGEAYYEISSTGHTMTFGGMSGVVYGLFGYVWMKGRFEPEQGMILHPSTVQTMLFWLVACMLGFLGNIANAAHLVGLLSGMLLGLARI
jgi:GlpG protein